jgi:DNA-binding CsgD family transcriptional regulator
MTCDHGAAPGTCEITGCEHALRVTLCACGEVATGAGDGKGRPACHRHAASADLELGAHRAGIDEPRKNAGMISGNVAGVDVHGELPDGAGSWEWLPYRADGSKVQQPVHVRGARYRQPGRGHAPKRDVLSEDLRRIVGAAKLTPEQLAPLELQTRGLTYEEIAEQLEVSITTVRERLRRARDAIRRARARQTE